MEDEREDVVVPDSSTGPQEIKLKDVNMPEDPSPQVQPAEAEPEEATPSTQEVKEEVVVDDRPVGNVAWEAKRKVDLMAPKLDMILEHMQKGTQQQPQQQQYSKAQLQAYAVTPDTTTEQRLWAYGEIDKLEKSERTKEYENIMRSTEEKSDSKTKRGQAAQWVATTFPDVVTKDSFGNPVGWKHEHPVLMRANEYIGRSKALQADPEGFAAAVKMAAFDLGVTSSKKLSKKVDRTLGQLRKEQKKQLASAGGTRPIMTSETASKTRLAKLQAEYAKTGNKEIFVEIVKLKRMNPFS